MWTELFTGSSVMSEKKEKTIGAFAHALTSLQLQLKTLLEGAGGDDAVQFLDNLSTLNPSEQKLVLKIFSAALDEIKAGGDRLVTAEDQVLKDFEDGLYNDILSSMREAANGGSPTRRRIRVLEGGKGAEPERKILIDLAEARKNRRLRPKDLLN
jgi:hypothetical protein